MLLGLVAVAHELVDAQVGVGAVAEPHGRGSTGDLLHHQHVIQVSQGRSTILRWEERKKLMLPTTCTRSWGWAQHPVRSRTLRMLLGLPALSWALLAFPILSEFHFAHLQVTGIFCPQHNP